MKVNSEDDAPYLQKTFNLGSLQPVLQFVTDCHWRHCAPIFGATLADLQWLAKSVRKAFDRVLSQTGSHEKALEELSRLQRRLISKDATKVWGKEHPDASGANET